MIKRLLLVLLFIFTASVARAQNVTCPTRPPGDSSNACASTAFVGHAVGSSVLPGVTGQVPWYASPGSVLSPFTPGAGALSAFQVSPNTVGGFALYPARPTTGIFQVQENQLVNNPAGERFNIRGVAMFDYLFESFEFRGFSGGVPTNQGYRKLLSPSGTGPAAQVSEPTYMAKWLYINHANILSQLTQAQSLGINFIRIGVDPAVMFAIGGWGGAAPNTYIDPGNSQVYPSDPVMLDDIVQTATNLGIVVELTQADDPAGYDPQTTYPGCGGATIITCFQTWLATRYKANVYVWLNPGNEINTSPWLTSSSTSITNPHICTVLTSGLCDTANGALTQWVTLETNYIDAIRATGFTGPIVLNTPAFSAYISTIFPTVSATAPFDTDGNIAYGIHVYPQPVSGSGATLVVDNNWQNLELSSYGIKNFWLYQGFVPLFIEETGINNNFGGCSPLPCIYNPQFGTSLSLTANAEMLQFGANFLAWAHAQTQGRGRLIGTVTNTWFGYVPLVADATPSVYSGNSAYIANGSSGPGAISSWGQEMVDYIWAPFAITLPPGPLDDTRGSMGWRNFLHNPDGLINQRRFAGGTITAGKFGYDRWFVPTAASGTQSVTVAAPVTTQAYPSTWTLGAGTFVAQRIDNPNFQCQAVTVSLDNPTLPVTVYIGNISNPAQYNLGIAAGSGKQYNTFYLPCSPANTTGNMYFTIQNTNGSAASYSHPQVELGTFPTPDEVRPPVVELAICQAYYEKSYDQSVAPGTASTNVGSSFATYGPVASAALITNTSVHYSVTKVKQPTITLYSPSTGATGKAFDNVNAADVASTANSAYNGLSGFTWSASVSTNTTTLSIDEQWAADADTND